MGKQQQGIPFFVRATSFAGKLPLKDRNMLDIYADLWLRQKFNDAFGGIDTTTCT